MAVVICVANTINRLSTEVRKYKTDRKSQEKEMADRAKNSKHKIVELKKALGSQWSQGDSFKWKKQSR